MVEIKTDTKENKFQVHPFDWLTGPNGTVQIYFTPNQSRLEGVKSRF